MSISILLEDATKIDLKDTNKIAAEKNHLNDNGISTLLNDAFVTSKNRKSQMQTVKSSTIKSDDNNEIDNEKENLDDMSVSILLEDATKIDLKDTNRIAAEKNYLNDNGISTLLNDAFVASKNRKRQIQTVKSSTIESDDRNEIDNEKENLDDMSISILLDDALVASKEANTPLRRSARRKSLAPLSYNTHYANTSSSEEWSFQGSNSVSIRATQKNLKKMSIVGETEGLTKRSLDLDSSLRNRVDEVTMTIKSIKEESIDSTGLVDEFVDDLKCSVVKKVDSDNILSTPFGDINVNNIDRNNASCARAVTNSSAIECSQKEIACGTMAGRLGLKPEVFGLENSSLFTPLKVKRIRRSKRRRTIDIQSESFLVYPQPHLDKVTLTSTSMEMKCPSIKCGESKSKTSGQTSTPYEDANDDSAENNSSTSTVEIPFGVTIKENKARAITKMSTKAVAIRRSKRRCSIAIRSGSVVTHPQSVLDTITPTSTSVDTKCSATKYCESKSISSTQCSDANDDSVENNSSTSMVLENPLGVAVKGNQAPDVTKMPKKLEKSAREVNCNRITSDSSSVKTVKRQKGVRRSQRRRTFAVKGGSSLLQPLPCDSSEIISSKCPYVKSKSEGNFDTRDSSNSNNYEKIKVLPSPSSDADGNSAKKNCASTLRVASNSTDEGSKRDTTPEKNPDAEAGFTVEIGETVDSCLSDAMTPCTLSTADSETIKLRNDASIRYTKFSNVSSANHNGTADYSTNNNCASPSVLEVVSLNIISNKKNGDVVIDSVEVPMDTIDEVKNSKTPSLGYSTPQHSQTPIRRSCRKNIRPKRLMDTILPVLAKDEQAQSLINKKTQTNPDNEIKIRNATISNVGYVSSPIDERLPANGGDFQELSMCVSTILSPSSRSESSLASSKQKRRRRSSLGLEATGLITLDDITGIVKESAARKRNRHESQKGDQSGSTIFGEKTTPMSTGDLQLITAKSITMSTSNEGASASSHERNNSSQHACNPQTYKSKEVSTSFTDNNKKDRNDVCMKDDSITFSAEEIKSCIARLFDRDGVVEKVIDC